MAAFRRPLGQPFFKPLPGDTTAPPIGLVGQYSYPLAPPQPYPTALYTWINRGILPLAVTLTADPGTYATTGTAALFQVIMPAAAGSYSTSGTDATFRTALAAAAGTYSTTGTAATFTTIMPANAGSYITTGTDAVLYTATILSAAAGSYATTGTAVTFTTIMPATAGSYSTTGTAASFRSALTAAPSSYATAGVAVTFTTVMPASAGSYTTIGSDANLVVITAGTLVAGSGIYLTVGSDATLQIITPPAVEAPPSIGGPTPSKRRRYERKFEYDRPYLAEYAEALRRALVRNEPREAEAIATELVEVATIAAPASLPQVQFVIETAAKLEFLEQLNARTQSQLAQTLVVAARIADRIIADDEEEVLLLF